MNDEVRDIPEYDTGLARYPFILKDKDGVRREYYLEELNGRRRDAYFNTLAARTRFDKQGRPAGTKDFDGMYSKLLTLGAYTKDGDTVPEAMIQTWPARVQEDLVKRLKELSGLDDDAEDKAGND